MCPYYTQPEKENKEKDLFKINDLGRKRQSGT